MVAYRRWSLTRVVAHGPTAVNYSLYLYTQRYDCIF